MPKELLNDQDLICVLGAFIIARAKQPLLDLIKYIRSYSAQDIVLIWDYISESLSNEEKDWFHCTLQESVSDAYN